MTTEPIPAGDEGAIRGSARSQPSTDAGSDIPRSPEALRRDNGKLVAELAHVHEAAARLARATLEGDAREALLAADEVNRRHRPRARLLAEAR